MPDDLTFQQKKKQYIFIVLINYVYEWFACFIQKRRVPETVFLFRFNLFVWFQMDEIYHSHKWGIRLELSNLKSSSSIFVRFPCGCMDDSVTHVYFCLYIFVVVIVT